MILAEGTFHHVYDFFEFELPFGLKLPLPHAADTPVPPGWGLTRFMLLQLLAVGLAIYVFRGLAARIQGGKPARGWFWNFWEMLALYIRDRVVRPVIGDPHHHGHNGEHDSTAGIETPAPLGHDHDFGPNHFPSVPSGVCAGHPADKYLPFIWSAFFYILFCNLLGAVPWFGSPTGDINVTGALALCAFAATFLYGAQMHGPVGFFTHMVPKIAAPPVLKQLLVAMIFGIEVIGLFIKHGVLCVRLFANIMGGHTVLAVVLAFIAQTAHSGWWVVVAPGSILGQIGIGLLEVLVAFIQAYVFSFLSSIFIAMSLHEH